MSGINVVLTAVIAMFAIIVIACIAASSEENWSKAYNRAETFYTFISVIAGFAVVAWLVALIYKVVE